MAPADILSPFLERIAVGVPGEIYEDGSSADQAYEDETSTRVIKGTGGANTNQLQ